MIGSRKEGFSKMVSARALSVIFLISVASSSLLTQKGMSPQLKTCTSSEEVMIGYLGKVNAFT